MQTAWALGQSKLLMMAVVGSGLMGEMVVWTWDVSQLCIEVQQVAQKVAEQGSVMQWVHWLAQTVALALGLALVV